MSTDLITEIQAAPREFAAKLETTRSALEAVTAQLAAVTAERDTARAEVARLTAQCDFLNGGAVADKQEIDNLLAENERLTAALEAANTNYEKVDAEDELLRKEILKLMGVMELLIEKADIAWATLDHTENEAFVSCLGDAVDNARAALRGDPAPATE